MKLQRKNEVLESWRPQGRKWIVSAKNSGFQCLAMDCGNIAQQLEHINNI